MTKDKLLLPTPKLGLELPSVKLKPLRLRRTYSEFLNCVTNLGVSLQCLALNLSARDLRIALIRIDHHVPPHGLPE